MSFNEYGKEFLYWDEYPMEDKFKQQEVKTPKDKAGKKIESNRTGTKKQTT